MRNKTLLIICFVLSVFFSKSQVVPIIDSSLVKPKMLDTDSILRKGYQTNTQVFPKYFPEDFQEKFKTSDFDYTSVKPRESLWERIKRNIEKILNYILGDTKPTDINSYTQTIIRILGILIFGVLLYFIIKFITNKQGNFFFSKKNKKITIIAENITENIHEINFPQSISQFEKLQDYRMAIRYQFLFLLKKLSDKNIISWNMEKTNRDYLLEIKDINLKTDYKNLNYIFENVWYGEFKPTNSDYAEFKTQFENTKI